MDSEPLCRPYEPFWSYPHIYSKSFLPGKKQIALRPACMPGDLAVVNKWFAGYFQRTGTHAGPFHVSADYYTTTVSGANSQSLLGFIDDQPAFQVDVYQSLFASDGLTQCLACTDNDYIMQLMLAPEIFGNPATSVCALIACLDCFFSYPEVARVIWVTGVQEKYLHMIAAMAELEELESDDPLQSFHLLTKEQFRQNQSNMPAWPEKLAAMQW